MAFFAAIFLISYATEAALVWTQQRLWADPNFPGTADCETAGPTLEGYPTQVTVTNCGADNNHQIQARIANY